RGGSKIVNIHVSSIDEGKLIGRYGPIQMTCRLGGTETAAVDESRKDVAVSGVLDLGVQARRQAKVSAPLDPVLGIRDGGQGRPLRHMLYELLLQLERGDGNWERIDRRHDGLPVLSDPQEPIGTQRSVEKVRLASERVFQGANKPIRSLSPTA